MTCAQVKSQIVFYVYGEISSDAEERVELRHAYLGNVTWADACDAVALALDSLPDTADDAVGAGIIPQTPGG